jgi:hypothetical protein
VLYLSMITLPLLYGPKSVHGLFSYDWQDGNVGLSYLAAALGILLGILVCMLFSNRLYQFMVRRHAERASISDPATNGSLSNDCKSHKPEFRIPLMQLGMIVIPLGLIIFAWTAERQPIHWTIPLLGMTLYSFGMILAYVSIQTYLVDTFGIHAASAIAAGVVMRGILGCVFTVIGLRLYAELGYGWGTTLLASIVLLFAPVPALLYVYGERLRGRGFSEKFKTYR